jgi:hypothetical protein
MTNISSSFPPNNIQQPIQYLQVIVLFLIKLKENNERELF